MKFELSDLVITAHDNGIYVHRVGHESWKDEVLVGNAYFGSTIEDIIRDAEQLLD